MDDRTLALCEISNDLLFHKIPRERLSYYVDGALKAGYEAAQALAEADLEKLYHQKNIKVEYREDGKGAFGMAYRGQITLSKDGCSLVVFQSSIRDLAANSQNGCYAKIDYDQARKIHLAHEYFHFLEYEKKCFVSALLQPVTTFRMFGLKRQAQISRCSEVAAHAFAKALLGLPILPNYYDYLYLINTGAMTAEGLQIKIANCRKFLAYTGEKEENKWRKNPF